MRLITNGVHDVSVAERAAKLKLDKYTVALTSADPVQWKRLTYADDTNDERQQGADFTLSEWCAFVDALTQSGRKVEVTTPVAPGVDVNLARELATSLGAVEFRTREYFA
jgi:pyruvate-formate lyase-activating enzyme